MILQGISVFGGGWSRDLATDIKAIREWGSSAVVTLIDEHEFAMLAVQALPDAFREAGIEWHHLRVKDVHAPDQRFETWWVHAGARLREQLRAGDRVLVHCLGGLGRAGSVAGQLYGAKHGLSALPADAVTRVDVLEPLLELFAEWATVRSGSRP